MLSFNPDEYRQRLNLALGLNTSAIGAKPVSVAPAQISNPYDTEQAEPMQQQPRQSNLPQGQGGLGSAGGLPDTSAVSEGEGGGAEMGHWEGSPNLGAMTNGAAIEERGAMGASAPPAKFPMGQNGKIDTRPPDLDTSGIDDEKLMQSKTIDEVFDAAPEKTQNEYMKWWEDSYGSINEKYDAMRRELGEHKKLPEKMTGKQKFVMLLAYGARMASNMRRGSDADPMAASDDAFGFAQDTVAGNRMTESQFAQGAGAIEGARARDLKSLGTRGDAMNKSSEIDYRNAQRENLGGGKEFTDRDGSVFSLDPKGKATPVMGPDGKQLKGPQNLGAGGSRNEALETERERRAEYMRVHGVDAQGNRLTGAKLRAVEAKALEYARYGTMPKDESVNLDDLRAQASDRVSTMLRSNPDMFRGMEPDEVAAKTGELEEREFARLKRQNLGSSPVHDGPRARAPERSENFVRQRPEALEDFVSEYGYVPEGMEQFVTPAMKKRMGL